MKSFKKLSVIIGCVSLFASVGSMPVSAHRTHSYTAISYNQPHYKRLYINKIVQRVDHKELHDDPMPKSLMSQLNTVMPHIPLKSLTELIMDDATVHFPKSISYDLDHQYYTKSFKSVRKLQRAKMNRNERALIHYDFQDINHARKRYHKPVLHWGYNSQRLADLRIDPTFKAYVNNQDPHGVDQATDKNGTLHYDRLPLQADIDKIHDSYDNILSGMASENSNDLNYTNKPNAIGEYNADNGSHYYKYSASTPKQLASAMNNAYMYHDQDAHNGHRHNILSDDAHTIGIASKYDPKTNNLATIEVFGQD